MYFLHLHFPMRFFFPRLFDSRRLLLTDVRFLLTYGLFMPHVDGRNN